MKIRQTEEDVDQEVLSVADLMLELDKFDPEAAVSLEGCDCFGWAKGVQGSVEENLLVVTILRNKPR